MCVVSSEQYVRICVTGHVEEQHSRAWVHWSWASYLLCLRASDKILVDIVSFRDGKAFEFCCLFGTTTTKAQ